MLSFISFLIFVGVAYLLNSKNIIHVNFGTNNYWQNIKSFFTKEKNEDPEENNTDQAIENEFITIFRSRLPSKRLEYASSSEISENGDMKIYLKGTKNESGFIYVNTNDKAEYVWITFVSAIDKDPLKSRLLNELDNLEYFDLRFNNKVFYKFNSINNDVQYKKDTASSSSIDLSNTANSR